MIRRSKSVALACVLVFGLVSCARATGPGAPAALRYADNHMEWCTSISVHPDLAIGIPVDPRGDDPITLKSVEPVDGSGIRIAGTWVVPIDPDNRVGSTDWPIPGDQEWWTKRQPAVDAQLVPRHHHDLVLHVQHTGPGAGLIRDVTITYEQSGKIRTAFTHLAIRMATGEC